MPLQLTDSLGPQVNERTGGWIAEKWRETNNKA